MDRRQHLERLIMGLEQSIPDLKSRVRYDEDGDLEKKYTERFLKSMEENLGKSRRELAELDGSTGGEPQP